MARLVQVLEAGGRHRWTALVAQATRWHPKHLRDRTASLKQLFTQLQHHARSTAWLGELDARFGGALQWLSDHGSIRRSIAPAPSMARSAIVLALGVALVNMFLLSNDAILAAAEDPWENYVDVDPTQTEAAVREISKYTPILTDVDPEAVSVALTASDASDFLPRPNQEDRVTEATELERSYVVEKGDTVTTIATKFDLHVASILERNQLSVDEIEALQPGDELIIPSRDTSDSTEWLTALNDKKEAERVKAEAERQKWLAQSRRTATARAATTRERSSAGFDGDGATDGFIVPISHNGITRGVGRGHDGIDYRANIGTPVRAAAAGRVVEITGGWGGGFGVSILVDHGGGVNTRYAHLSSASVGIGDPVDQGEEVGRSGNSGFSTGPHLHFETRRGGRVVRPF